jgi:hypothetical protein
MRLAHANRRRSTDITSDSSAQANGSTITFVLGRPVRTCQIVGRPAGSPIGHVAYTTIPRSAARRLGSLLRGLLDRRTWRAGLAIDADDFDARCRPKGVHIRATAIGVGAPEI